jgi:quercetin dioxygenase-like cupin family protein
VKIEWKLKELVHSLQLKDLQNFLQGLRIDPLFQTHNPARAVGASVTFEPGARTAWHVHPLGQTLIVTTGCGLVQRWDAGNPI